MVLRTSFALALGSSTCSCGDASEPSRDASIIDSGVSMDATSGDSATAEAAVELDAGSTSTAPDSSIKDAMAEPLDAHASDAKTANDDSGAPAKKETLVFVGGSAMVQAFTLNTETGALSPVGQVELGPNPSYLVASADGRFLYAANESDGNPGVTAATIGAGGRLTKLATRAYAGDGHKGLVHVNLDPSGKFLLAADYNGGHAAVFPVQADGTLGAAIDDESFGGQANTHGVRVHRTGKWAYVPNKGLDNVAQFAFDQATGKLTPLNPASVSSSDGARHIALHPTAEYAYVINENDATLRAFSIAATGQLTQIDQKPTLPTGFMGTNAAAHVLVHPNGRFVYASNRGYDRVSIFAAGTDGKLTLVENTATLQKPRDFDIDPAGAFLVVAGQDESKVAAYAIGTDGRLSARGQPVSTTASPAAVAIVTREAL